MTDLSVFGKYDAAELSNAEIFWRDHYSFLKQHGYTLRKRYDPAWVPSWLNTSKSPRECEDGHRIPYGQALDATRTDGTLVVLKRLDLDKNPDEVSIVRQLASGTFASNPRNHCVHVLEVIDPPKGSRMAFIVMPLLLKIDSPPFETIGEAVGFCKQIFEVIP
ncbi:hypothetical protein C0993_002013 [Termitomyces sp. T159_Od127]|nr:hypothetical protein C0993_002013 [Termitomyces sp. T159_Od127]